MRFRLMCMWPWLLLVPFLPAFAADMSSISGVVHSNDGEPLLGVTVQLGGDSLPNPVAVQTGRDGRFQFPDLQPGSYSVSAELKGLGSTQQDATVVAGQRTDIQLTLTPPVTAVLVAGCPSLSRVVLRMPQFNEQGQPIMVPGDPLAGGFARQMIDTTDLNSILGYLDGGACPGNKILASKPDAAIEVFDASTTKALLDMLRREVIAATESAVAAASVRDEELTALQEIVFKEVRDRFATGLLKELSQLKAQVAELTARLNAQEKKR